MRDLILIRGIPGSGKSTLAELICLLNSQMAQSVSADDYFTNKDTGEYLYDKTKINNAHKYCKSEVEKLMQMGQSAICVHNTFTRQWEFEPYYELAYKYDYRIHSLIVENRHGANSIHGVPQSTIEKMRSRFNVSL